MAPLAAQLGESALNAEDPGLIPGLGRSPGEGNSYPLQYYSGQRSLVGCSTWSHRSWTQLRD